MDDEDFMRLALKLARRGQPSPNPYVGAVIVKEGQIIATGYHKRAGMPHAEIEALNNLAAPLDARGATMYVNLEPCNHFGRTPPCAPALAEAGIKKVVFGAKDQNPDVRGNGEAELRKHGVEAVSGVLGQEAMELNEVFFKYTTAKTPFVVVKAAMSMDGKIATRAGDSKWITSEESRKHARKLRSMYDAVAVGINTILADDPMLTARVRGGKDPMRVILDGELRIPMGARALVKKEGEAVIVATSERFDLEKKKALEGKGITVLVCGKDKVELKPLLEMLGKMDVTSLLVEGGSEVQGAFMDECLADKVVFFYAPLIIGGEGAKVAVGGKGAEKISGALKLERVKIRRIGQDFMIEGYPVL